MRAWEIISPHVLKQAWSVYFDDGDDEPERQNNVSNSFEKIDAVHIVE
jgi:hypothetical protein